jgi:hypothetical protein
MTLAYRKGAQNEVDPLSRRPDFVAHTNFACFEMVRFYHTSVIRYGSASFGHLSYCVVIKTHTYVQ